MTRETMGRIDPRLIRLFDLPAAPEGVVVALAAIDGPCELVSDALDDLGFDGVIAASVLRPTIAGATMVGPAITLRNRPLEADPFVVAREGHMNRQADFEAHNLTRPGDVLVIEGRQGISNLGGISATMGKRQGGLGAVIDGGIRDVRHSRRIGYPVWCSDITARTGRWRQETVEINGPVTIRGVPVHPGDIVCADDSAVCIIPLALADEVTRRVLKRVVTDRASLDFLATDRPLSEFPRPDARNFRE
ncbi:RraA family protein [Shinella kummerowiae]|jgi:4-hydroxy-4-methyl-2-oxoglutarate aldolase|uniref:Putative 4-hydroxy-4-methyl-2-oxoglutarate aldolase n=1 Tax=Shinella kummerowiae TaxID=417745 RepID=A0A6N8SQR3_9HYPH|nr:RraA family protein [Shinella kummerowiae]MXN49280.1 RraA family protein [Shinella kummerowiae]